jgi:hypothetical protein
MTDDAAEIGDLYRKARAAFGDIAPPLKPKAAAFGDIAPPLKPKAPLAI